MVKNDALLLSFMLRMGEVEEMTVEDIKNTVNKEVSDCQIELYLKVINLIGKNTPYDKIMEFIDSYKEDEFDDLLEDQKTYIKAKAKSDLNKRRKKLEGEDINE